MEHFCNEHQTKFFKGGKMKGFAHPIEVNGQTVGWCNEDGEKSAKAEAVASEDKPTPSPNPITKDPTRTSIERQKSLDIAERWCSMQFQKGEKVKTFNILAIAKLFEEYLDTGIVVEDK